MHHSPFPVLSLQHLALGFRTVLGTPGIGVAAILVILLGNPLSGLASGPEFLPTSWGAIGQLLLPGATGRLLRREPLVLPDAHWAT